MLERTAVTDVTDVLVFPDGTFVRAREWANKNLGHIGHIGHRLSADGGVTTVFPCS